MSIQHKDGQASVPKTPDESEDISIKTNAFVARLGKMFCSDVTQYEWKSVEKKEMVVPYNCEAIPFRTVPDSNSSNIRKTRWEKHHVWIVEGTVIAGESNFLAVRRFYIDEESWAVLLGEGYDNAGKMVACYMLDGGTIPATSRAGQWYPL
jgi:hypothetical protein